jgi:nucleotide-binding universal stress UspA family protein
MNTNLLLLDSYKDIDDLIAYAFSLSNRSKRHLKIVYVFDFDWMRQSFVVGSAGPVDPALVAVEKNAKKEFDVAEAKIREVAADYIKKHAVKIPFEIHITKMNRIDVVQDELDRASDLMLLISNHQSYSEASGGLMGYPNLIEHVSCPVFVIPENLRHAVLKRIVYATDFNPSDTEALKHLSSLFENSDDIHFSILHNAKDYVFEEKLKWLGFRELVNQETGMKNLSFSLKTSKDIVHAIEEFAKEAEPDLLVLLKEKRGFFEEMFTSDETKSVLTHFHKPVLVYHEK